jgi:hypothetical protein
MPQLHIRIDLVLRDPLQHLVRRNLRLLLIVLVRLHRLLSDPLQLIILHLAEAIGVEIVLDVLLYFLLAADGLLDAVK